MHLRRLELHGYKTFASRTEFVFNSGITAIVGPNGSGKSNLADAIRWVLGEQNYALLRGKRTEDMIYAGSERRPQAGMAQATLVFDNSGGWLPLDFAEVSITRRAYRSGENEYFLNGSRVRLKEITELLAASGLAGRTYAIVGQGLIDTALSLRPEERRTLIEEAAGISLYRAKREEALRRLDEAQRNMQRVQDILAEITPRLRQLERQAQRANEHAQIRAELGALLRTWYGYQIGQAQAAYKLARATAEEAATALEQARRATADLDERLRTLRREAADLRAQLADWSRQEGQLRAARDRAERECAVQSERLKMLRAQREEAAAEAEALAAQRQAQAERLAAAEAELQPLQAQSEAAQAAAQAARAALAAHQAEQRAAQKKHQEAERRLAQLAIALAERQAQIAHFTAYRADLARQLQDNRARLEEIAQALEAVQAQLKGGSLAEMEAQVAAAHVRLASSAAAIGQAEAALAQVSAQLAQAQAELARLAERRRLLARQAAGPGESQAAGAVIARARAGQVRGIWGLAGHLLHPRDGFEHAISAALGPDYDAIVVNTWQDIRAVLAIAPPGSRLTFLPLAELRPPVPLTVLLGWVSDGLPPGVLGVASHFVQVERVLRPVVDDLLGRTLIVEDLDTARRWLPQLPPGASVVTLAGEVLRAGGAATLGSPRQGDQAPGAPEAQALAEAEAEACRLAEHHEATQREQALRLETLRQEHAQNERRVAEAEEALRQARARDAERQQAARLAQEQARLQERVLQLEEEIAALDRRLAGLQSEVESLETERAAAGSLPPQPPPLEEEGVEERLIERALTLEQEAAAARQAYQNRLQEVTALRRALGDLEARDAAQRKRAERLAAEEQASAQALAAAENAWATSRAQWATLHEKTRPARARLAELEAMLAEVEAGEAAARRARAEAEDRYTQAHLEAAQRQAALAALQRQAEEELLMEDGGRQTTDDDPAPGLSLPSVEALPPGIETALQERRARLRRLGAVNPEALSEYTEVQSRHAFLTRELADLEAASSQLQRVIAELDALIQRDFRRTFQAVNTEFKALFTRLFGGGSAHLVLTDPHDIARSGIEVMARPPGKKQQPLALLSGGERALTATALLFAILKVSPTPFCVLDEVDAMLDDANVGRFRQVLQELSQRVQCIVITHNRATVEAADTVYGISLTPEGTSQVISLKLEGKTA
jgi:chromosome segregation protein